MNYFARRCPVAGECILIVEDERAVARGLEYGLQAEGFETVWAATGQQVLDLARSQDPQLILLDIRLPDISGFDVCRQLRAEGKRQPILMLTARDEETDKVLGLELGADDYVVKPYILREVISRVRALLRRAYGELAAPTGGTAGWSSATWSLIWSGCRSSREGVSSI
jgi:DNA-binding response OmpR family regulator